MTLKKDLDLFEKATKPNPYEDHFLLDNPFPGHGETRFDVCTDQGEIKREFVNVLRGFSPEAKRIRINGKSGAGKTNILRYFERLTEEALRSGLIKAVHPIYVFSPGESYFDIHKQVVGRFSELFLGELLTKLRSNPGMIDKLKSEIKPAAELLAAIKAITSSRTLVPLYYEERQKDIFIRWLKGDKLLATDRKLLTDEPLPDISNSSLAIRFLDGFLQVLRKLGLCDGIVLLFDEFEEIFEGLTRSRQSRYAQDLRHLFDTLKESVFFVVATIPEPKDLAQYPAIERRLGKTLALQPIDNAELAITYVSDYLNEGRDRYEQHQRTLGKQVKQKRPEGLEPLTKEIVEEEYQSLKTETSKAELDIRPGFFLPRMRERMKSIVEAGG